ncbi:hypothetical protein [Oceanobacter sp. 3_MG-2023]|uniref:hypothetical protein n=1 Tax=Oceanobacter sp. 3_MG-2023 TaxID=3062622 RepID=UPI002732C143|nr:hypothetical protein [Oceanobacter sp. 3_MG-2023]MDP2505423.1 hypothetical protein [Oceanobacter sp. 3_MG-2023]
MKKCEVCGCEEIGQGGYLQCECPAPASSGNSELLLREPVEDVTKAILFEDCGSTEGWQDNTELGEAACKAYRSTLFRHCQFWRNDALEAAAKIAERYGQINVANDIRALIAQ